MIALVWSGNGLVWHWSGKCVLSAIFSLELISKADEIPQLCNSWFDLAFPSLLFLQHFWRDFSLSLLRSFAFHKQFQIRKLVLCFSILLLLNYLFPWLLANFIWKNAFERKCPTPQWRRVAIAIAIFLCLRHFVISERNGKAEARLAQCAHFCFRSKGRRPNKVPSQQIPPNIYVPYHNIYM